MTGTVDQTVQDVTGRQGSQIAPNVQLSRHERRRLRAPAAARRSSSLPDVGGARWQQPSVQVQTAQRDGCPRPGVTVPGTRLRLP